jgi:predicted Ser/Thr protein kinase
MIVRDTEKPAILLNDDELQIQLNSLFDEAIQAVCRYETTYSKFFSNHLFPHLNFNSYDTKENLQQYLKFFVGDKPIRTYSKIDDIWILTGLALRFITTLFYLVEKRKINHPIVELFLPILEKATNIKFAKDDLICTYEQVKTQVGQYIPASIKSEEFSDISFLEEGGHGKVYKALWGDQQVALKVFETPDAFYELFYEFSIMKQLNETGIAPKVYGFITSSNNNIIEKYTLAMEYIGEMNLYTLITKEAEKAFPHRGLIVNGIFSGLAALHNMGLVHGDIKLQNFLVNHLFQVKICDFGHAVPLINNRPFSGTILYIAPEVKNNCVPASDKTDVYGCTLSALEVMLLLCIAVKIVDDMLTAALKLLEIMQKDLIHDNDLRQKTLRSETLKIHETLCDSIDKRHFHPSFSKKPLPDKIAHLITLGMCRSPEQRPTAQEMAAKFEKSEIQEAISSFVPSFTKM